MAMWMGRGEGGEQVVEGEGRERESTSANKYPGNTETRKRKAAGNEGTVAIQYPKGAQRFARDRKARSMDQSWAAEPRR